MSVKLIGIGPYECKENKREDNGSQNYVRNKQNKVHCAYTTFKAVQGLLRGEVIRDVRQEKYN